MLKFQPFPHGKRSLLPSKYKPVEKTWAIMREDGTCTFPFASVGCV